MYFKIVKHKTEERVFLEAHPLVRFINHPIDQIAITDGLHMRVQVVDTKQSKIDIVDRLKKDTKVYKRLFIIYPPNESDVYWETYHPLSFEGSKMLRMAEIEVTEQEWRFMMQDEIAKREAEYKKSLEVSEKENNKYRFLVIKR